jgi:hypothetical protein
MNLGGVFIIREFSDGRRELEWADGLLGLTESAGYVNLLNYIVSSHYQHRQDSRIYGFGSQARMKSFLRKKMMACSKH